MKKMFFAVLTLCCLGIASSCQTQQQEVMTPSAMREAQADARVFLTKNTDFQEFTKANLAFAARHDAWVNDLDEAAYTAYWQEVAQAQKARKPVPVR
jgi:hypothetical protein